MIWPTADRARARRYLWLCATALAGAAAACPALAATATPTDPTPDEIVVTALKRGSTPIQQTPISITAVTGDRIAEVRATKISDLASLVPGLTFVDAGQSFRRVVMRGIESAGEPTVGVYYDETPVSGMIGAGNDAGASTPELRLFDVERVEALKGPQGTLYGAGSMGGTLRVIYNKPQFETQGLVDASVSDTHYGGVNYNGQAMVNLPVVADKIAVRAVGFYQRNEGYIDQVWLGIRNINDAKTYGGRLMVRLMPTERLTIDGAAYYDRSTTDTAYWVTNVGKYQNDARLRLPIRDKTRLYSGTANWDLGGVKATGVVSYMDRDLSIVSDVSRYIQRLLPLGCQYLYNGGVPCPAPTYSAYLATNGAAGTSGLDPQQAMHALTAELRLASAAPGPVNWTVGGFYSRRTTNVANYQLNADPATGVIYQPYSVDTVRYVHDVLRQLAAYADVSWDITPRLSIAGGARYFDYHKDVIGHTDIAYPLLGIGVIPRTEYTSHEHGTVVRANASYKVTPNVMGYFEASQGFRPGGANQVIGLPNLVPYKSDSLWDYEAGLKTQWLDRRLTVDVDIFRIDWSNMQVAQRTSDGRFSYIANGGAARVQGVEAEASLTPLRGLTIDANAAYMDARLTEDQPAAHGVGYAYLPSAGLKGDRIPYVPKFTGRLGARYVFPLTDRFNASLGGDMSYSGGYYSDFRPNYALTRHIKGYELASARAGLEAPDGSWGVYLFCDNLFDATAIMNATADSVHVSTAGLPLTNVTSATPRTIGLNVRSRF